MGEDELESQKQRMQPAKGELSNKREKWKENPTLRRIACEGISGWLADALQNKEINQIISIRNQSTRCINEQVYI